MPQIVTLTPNPAIDLSTAIERVVPSLKLRCAQPRRDPGGGGVNVARVVKRFGGDTEAILPVGGLTGELLRRLLEKEDVSSCLIKAEAETREDFSVTERGTGSQYRFVLPGEPLRESEWRECLEALAASKPDFVVGSGSLPPGVPDDFYAQAAAIAHKLGAKFFLDTSGTPLATAIEHGVDMIKPNLREMRELVGQSLSSETDWIAAARGYIESGKVGTVALSLGHLGAMLITRDRALRALPPPIKPISTVGAGDSFFGAIVYSLAKGDALTDAFRLGVAAGSAALIQEGTGLCLPADAYRLMSQITVTPF
jgi:6-phosphofructokinase 2